MVHVQMFHDTSEECLNVDSVESYCKIVVCMVQVKMTEGPSEQSLNVKAIDNPPLNNK